MSRAAGTVPGEEGSAALRWALGGALALGLHGGAALLVIRSAAPEPLAAGEAGAIAVELEPVEGEQPKPDEVQPAVPADEAAEAAAPAAAAEASRAAPQAPPVEAPPPLTPPPTRPDPPPVQPPPEPPPPPPEPPPPPQVAPEAARPPPVAPPVQATQASAASAAADEAAPALERLAAARVAAWRGKLVPHLNRFRHFPHGVGSGTARIAFTIDAEGRVTSVSIASRSGDAALDAAAQALVERASPFPAPPPGVSNRDLTSVVPIQYHARHP